MYGVVHKEKLEEYVIRRYINRTTRGSSSNEGSRRAATGPVNKEMTKKRQNDDKNGGGLSAPGGSSPKPSKDIIRWTNRMANHVEGDISASVPGGPAELLNRIKQLEKEKEEKAHEARRYREILHALATKVVDNGHGDWLSGALG